MTFHQFYCLILQVVEERDKLKEENHKMKEFIRTVKQDVSKFTFIDEIDEDRDEKDDDDIPERSDSDKSQGLKESLQLRHQAASLQIFRNHLMMTVKMKRMARTKRSSAILKTL